MTSPIGSRCTQHGPETKNDPKSAVWLWFEVCQRYLWMEYNLLYFPSLFINTTPAVGLRIQ